MFDLIGKTIGPYRILEQIGVGGMATVYKAYQPSMDRYIALKILPHYVSEDQNFAKRFQREARAIAKLEHPHILPVYDYGEYEGVTYIAMRYVEAGTLKQHLAKGPLPLDEINRLIGQIGNALDYAHRLGVIHRDVKPSNVLIDEQGNTYLTDFGLARMMEASQELTGSGVGVGTPAYMSPEQGQGIKADHRSDLYSLGVILYEMVTGHVPFEAETPMAVMLKHITDPLPLPRTLRPDVPEAIERVILKALAKNPADRFQTAGELVQALGVASRKVSLAEAQRPATPVAVPAPAREDVSLVTRVGRLWEQPRGKFALVGGAVAVVLLLGLFLSQLPGRVAIVGPGAATSTSAIAQVSTPTGEATQPSPTPAASLTPVRPTATTTALTPTAKPPIALANLKWEQLYDGESFLRVALNALAVDPNDPNTIFAGTYGAGIYISRDGGETWEVSNEGLGKGTVGQIAVHPRDSNIMYAALFDQGGVYKSTDGGRTWTAANRGIDLDQAWNWTGLIYLDPSNSDQLYFTDTTSGLYRSKDGGASWSRQSRECPSVTGLVIDPANSDHLYAASVEHPNSACHAGVYESRDAGRTWKRLTTDEMVARADRFAGDWWHLAADPRNLRALYAGGWAGTFKSSDGGQTWTAIRGDGCQWLAVHPDDGAVFCGLGGQVEISYDGGESWVFSGFRSGLGGGERFPFAFVPGTQTLYAGGSEVVKSTDGGANWDSLGGLSAMRVRLAIDPQDGKRLFLSHIDSPGRVYRSGDGGQTWQVALDGLAPGGRVTFDSAQSVVYYPNGSALYRSKDNGLTWEEFGSGQPTNGAWQLLPDPRDVRKLWLVGECSTRPAVSDDGGETFSEVSNFPDNVCQPIMLMDSSGQRMYIVQWGAFYRSDNGGDSWRSLGGVSGIFRSAALDPSDPNVVYLGSTHRGVLKTTNGGQTWSQLASLPAASINDIAINPANTQTVYAATDSGAFVSFDSGETWSRIQTGLGLNPIVYSIAIDPDDSSRVFAVTPDGVYRLESTQPVAGACTAVSDGLVAWWPGDGHPNDIINGNHGTLQNDATFAPGIVGQAFSFDGDGDFVKVPRAPNLDVGPQLTIDLWMKADPSNPLDQCCQGLVTTDFYELAIAGGGAGGVPGVLLALFTTDGGFAHSSGGGGFPIPPGEWRHVAAVYDGSNLRMYVDGLLVAASSHTGDILPMRETSFLAIGSEDGRTNEPFVIGERYFHGLIDEVKIYDRALDAEEIEAIFNAGNAGICASPAPTRTPAPTSTPTTHPAQTFAEPILAAIADRPPDYQDDFSDPKSGWEVIYADGRRSLQDGYKDGELVLVANSASAENQIVHTFLQVPSLYVSDFVMEFDFRFASARSGHIYVHFRLGDPYASLDLATDGSVWLETKTIDGGTTTEATRVNLTGPNQANRLRIIVQGPQIALYLNGQPVLVARREIDKGGIILGIWNSSSTPMQVNFDNFKVWDISDLP